jgi:hypothetical protein
MNSLDWISIDDDVVLVRCQEDGLRITERTPHGGPKTRVLCARHRSGWTPRSLTRTILEDLTMVTLKFDEVELKELRAGKCSACGKRTRRRIKVWQTMNPFNVNEAGVPKTREEIVGELREELAEEIRRPLLCSGCEARP